MTGEGSMRELPYKKIALVLANIWMVIGLLALVYYLLGFVSEVVLWVVLAGVLAQVLYIPARRIKERFPGLPWAVVVLLLYVAILIIILVVSAGVGVSLSVESRNLAND